MALHTSLPIYKVTYDLLAVTTRTTRSVPRDYRSMANKLREECVEIVLLVYRANSAINKVPHLTALLERLQVAELLFRLCKDLKCISVDQYAAAIELTNSIGKQTNGWRKHSAAASPVT